MLQLFEQKKLYYSVIKRKNHLHAFVAPVLMRNKWTIHNCVQSRVCPFRVRMLNRAQIGSEIRKACLKHKSPHVSFRWESFYWNRLLAFLHEKNRAFWISNLLNICLFFSRKLRGFKAHESLGVCVTNPVKQRDDWITCGAWIDSLESIEHLYIRCGA